MRGTVACRAGRWPPETRTAFLPSVPCRARVGRHERRETEIGNVADEIIERVEAWGRRPPCEAWRVLVQTA